MDSNNDSETKFIQFLLDKSLEQVNKYKEAENTKILQFFHVTILLITALLAFNEIAAVKTHAYFLIISIFFVALAYLFLYLADLCNANTEIYSYFDNSTKVNIPNPTPGTIYQSLLNNDEINFFWTEGRMCRNCCLFSIIIAYILLFLAIYTMFDLDNLPCYYIIGYIIPAIVLIFAIYKYFSIADHL